MPKAGNTKMYTSGCPKNQKRCWYKSEFPPPEASKKQVLRLRSNRSMVIPQANTGRERINRNVVTETVHKNSTSLSKVNLPFPIRIVDIKLNLPTKLLTPAMCNLKMERSTDAP